MNKTQLNDLLANARHMLEKEFITNIGNIANLVLIAKIWTQGNQQSIKITQKSSHS